MEYSGVPVAPEIVKVMVPLLLLEQGASLVPTTLSMDNPPAAGSVTSISFCVTSGQVDWSLFETVKSYKPAVNVEKVSEFCVAPGFKV